MASRPDVDSMAPVIDGLCVSGRSDRGTFIQYELKATAPDADAVLAALLGWLPEGAEVSVPEPGPHECYHECRRLDGAFMIKRGCHGSYGDWRPATLAEAGAWLLPGFLLSATDTAAERVQLCIRPALE